MQPNIYSRIRDVSEPYNQRVAPKLRARTNVRILSSGNAGSMVLSAQLPAFSPIGPSTFLKGLVFGDLGSYDWPVAPSAAQGYAPLDFDVEHSKIVFPAVDVVVNGTHVTYGAGISHTIEGQLVLIQSPSGFMVCQRGVEYDHTGPFKFWGALSPASYGAPAQISSNGWTGVSVGGYDVKMVLLASV